MIPSKRDVNHFGKIGLKPCETTIYMKVHKKILYSVNSTPCRPRKGRLLAARTEWTEAGVTGTT